MWCMATATWRHFMMATNFWRQTCSQQMGVECVLSPEWSKNTCCSARDGWAESIVIHLIYCRRCNYVPLKKYIGNLVIQMATKFDAWLENKSLDNQVRWVWTRRIAAVFVPGCRTATVFSPTWGIHILGHTIHKWVAFSYTFTDVQP